MSNYILRYSVDHGRTLRSAGRLHIQSAEDLYLNPQGGHTYVGYGGGPGNLSVRGNVTLTYGDLYLGIRGAWLSAWLNQALLTSSSPTFGGVEIRADDADGRLFFHDPGNYIYAMGMDYSDGRKFKINRGGNLGDNNDFTIDTAGNVGVGTASPEAKLHVADSAKAGSDVPLRLASTDASNPMELEIQRVGNSYFGIQSAERNVAYRNLVLNPAAGNVGIGTTSPDYKLDVNGHAIVRGTVVISGGDYRIEAMWGVHHPFLALRAEDDFTVLKPASAGFRVTDYINVPLGRNNLILNNDRNPQGYQLFLPYGKLLEGSDTRQKLDQEPLDYGLAEVLRLEPKRYVHADSLVTLKTEEQESQDEDSGSEIGLIAQEVYEVVPEAVGRVIDNGREIWLLSYSSLVPVLVKAVQEQQEMIEKQKEINAAQEAKITSLEKRIATLEQR